MAFIDDGRACVDANGAARHAGGAASTAAFEEAPRLADALAFLHHRIGPVASRARQAHIEPKPVSEGAHESVEPDADLALRARAGDRDAFAELYLRFAGTVHGVLLAAAPREEARDLVQEVFLLALRAIGDLEDPQRIGPWLCTIARNRARDLLKSRAVAAANLDDVETVAAPTPGDGGDDEARRVLAAIRALPECYREPLILRLVDGSSGADIAARTGLTPGSVRINLHRGMKLLRARLAEQRT
jgi:RNA polymerase sigma-70 factor (ECF subfamily)